MVVAGIVPVLETVTVTVVMVTVVTLVLVRVFPATEWLFPVIRCALAVLGPLLSDWTWELCASAFTLLAKQVMPQQ